MKTEALIETLAKDAAPVRRLDPPSRRTGWWLLLALPVVAAGAAIDGLRPDLAQCLAEARFVLEQGAALLTGVLAGWAALASTVPGTPAWRLALPLVPATMWLASVGEGCWREWLAWGAGGLADKLWTPVCLPEVVATSVVPIAVMVAMARRGASFRPARTGALAALAAASLASAGLSLSHEEDAAVTALVWHLGTAGVLTGLGAVAGRRWIRPARSP